MNNSYLFLPVYLPGGYALAEALAALGRPTHATAFYDWLTYRRIHPNWPATVAPPQSLKKSMRVLPPGYAGALEPLFRPYLKSAIKRWVVNLERETKEHPWVVVTFPYFAPWVREIPAERLVYLNIDEYTLYRPERKDIIRRQEDELIERAAVTICLSQFQLDAFAARHPRKTSALRHLPLGVIESYLNTRPFEAPAPQTVGYVGNLIERIDWRLVYEVASLCADLTFVFVGGLEGFAGWSGGDEWKKDRAAALNLPNVRHIDEVPQREVASHYWSFAVNWIPYAVNHPFNQACCPTKIMDGLASGRPMVSTNIPECRLYPQWISVVENADQMALEIRRCLKASEEEVEAAEKMREQIEFARRNTWSERARQMDGWLSDSASRLSDRQNVFPSQEANL